MRKLLTFFLALATADVVNITPNGSENIFNNGLGGPGFSSKSWDAVCSIVSLKARNWAKRALLSVPCSRELVERGIADLTQHHLPAVQHGKLESQLSGSCPTIA